METVEGVEGTTTTSLRNPGWRRCLALFGLEGTAKMIFEGSIEGEGRMVEPTTEELLLVWLRTSCSAESSEINKGRM